MPEPLALYYTIEMLRVLETIHMAGIIHGDVRANKFLLRTLLRYRRTDRSRSSGCIGTPMCGLQWTVVSKH